MGLNLEGFRQSILTIFCFNDGEAQWFQQVNNHRAVFPLVIDYQESLPFPLIAHQLFSGGVGRNLLPFCGDRQFNITEKGAAYTKLTLYLNVTAHELGDRLTDS